FKPISDKVSLPDLEKEILAYWKTHRIFEKSVEGRQNTPDYTFYEGPPTANGKPGIHHVFARTIKDLVCRYQTMRGYQVHRKAGWDTHGLPVEIEVEKRLGLKHKGEIEKYGIARFNAECRKSVFEYKDMWEDLTWRMGYWIDILSSSSSPKIAFHSCRKAPRSSPACPAAISSGKNTNGGSASFLSTREVGTWSAATLSRQATDPASFIWPPLTGKTTTRLR